MANEVELITFTNKTVSPVYDAIIQELYTDGGGVITGCTVTIKDANHLHITEGYGVLCGREFKIVASDIPVQLSSSGNLNGRLYLHMDLSLATDPITLLVETGSTLTPVQQDANVNTTNGVYEVNLATFDVGTSAISNLQDVAPKAVKIPDALNSLNSALPKLLWNNTAPTSPMSDATISINLSNYDAVKIYTIDGAFETLVGKIAYGMLEASSSNVPYIWRRTFATSASGITVNKCLRIALDGGTTTEDAGTFVPLKIVGIKFN